MKLTIAEIIKNTKCSKSTECKKFLLSEEYISDNSILEKYINVANWLICDVIKYTDDFMNCTEGFYNSNQGMMVKALCTNPFTHMYFPWIVTEPEFSLIKHQAAKNIILYKRFVDNIALNFDLSIDVLLHNITCPKSNAYDYYVRRAFFIPRLNKSLKLVQKMFIKHLYPVYNPIMRIYEEHFSKLASVNNCMYVENLDHRHTYGDLQRVINNAKVISHIVIDFIKTYQNKIKLSIPNIMNIVGYMNGVHYNSAWLDSIIREKNTSLESFEELMQKRLDSERVGYFNNDYLRMICRLYGIPSITVLIELDFNSIAVKNLVQSAVTFHISKYLDLYCGLVTPHHALMPLTYVNTAKTYSDETAIEKRLSITAPSARLFHSQNKDLFLQMYKCGHML